MDVRAKRKIGSGLYFALLGNMRRNFFPKSAPSRAPNLEEEFFSTKIINWSEKFGRETPLANFAIRQRVETRFTPVFPCPHNTFEGKVCGQQVSVPE
jgi:hypothetical protein